MTRPPEQAQFEAHDIYADLQLLCRGGERVEWADRAVLSESVPYDADKDIAFFTAPASRSISDRACFMRFFRTMRINPAAMWAASAL